MWAAGHAVYRPAAAQNEYTNAWANLRRLTGGGRCDVHVSGQGYIRPLPAGVCVYTVYTVYTVFKRGLM